MSSENYISLLTIQNETIPQIRESIHNILNLFGDSEVTESIQAILDRYNQIAEFITSLGDNDNGQILYDILRDIADLKEFVTTVESTFVEVKAELTDVKDDNTAIHVILDRINNSITTINDTIQELGSNIAEQLISVNNRITATNNRIDQLDDDTQAALQDININLGNTVTRLNNKVNTLEETLNTETNRAIEAESTLANKINELEQRPGGGGGDSTKHIFLTQAEYDALESYEVDALYLIIERTESNTHFGDRFPLIFG